MGDFSSSSSVIVFSFVSSRNYSCSTSASSIFCSCVSIRRVASCVSSIGLMWPYGYLKRKEFTFLWWREIVAWGGAVLGVSGFSLKSFGRDPFLLLFWRSFFLGEFFFLNNGTLKIQVYTFLSCCIDTYFTPLLLSPHTIQSSFRYGIDEVLSFW